MLKYIHIYVISLALFAMGAVDLASSTEPAKETSTITVKATANDLDEGPETDPTRIFYGQASYYANKFEGRKTATGEIFRQSKLTAACNFLPLGTWVKITNLDNGKNVIAKTNDRLHTKSGRIVDLTRSGAKLLGYVSNGLTRVKVEVLRKKPA